MENHSFMFIDEKHIRGPSVDDISVEIIGANLQKAHETIWSSKTLSHQHASVLMFRNVINPKEINIKNYIKKLVNQSKNLENENYFVENAKICKYVDHVYYNQQMSMSKDQQNKLLNNFVNSSSDNIIEDKDSEKKNEKKNEKIHTISKKVKLDEDMWMKCAISIEYLFSNLESTYEYIRDIQIPPDECKNVLEILTSHLSPISNPDMTVIPGVNSAMHYIGKKGSFTAMHIEDGHTSSLNLLKYGGFKLWIIIHHKWQSEVEENFIEYLKNKGKDVPCKFTLQHKIYFITPKLLCDWKIPYTILIQKPGDLFFIRNGTYHAVINMEMNLAESINFGCHQWTNSYQPQVCDCDESRLGNVYQDRRIIVGYKVSKKKLYSCDIEQCRELFCTKIKREEHLKTVHGVKFQCTMCPAAVYTNSNNLRRHALTHSEDSGKQECDICQKKVVRLQEHKKRVHTEIETCDSCLKPFSAYAMKAHKKKCLIQCSFCLKIFANKRYLTQYIKAKHPEI